MSIVTIFKKTSIALLSLFIFMLGNGLFNTLVPLRLQSEHVSAFIIGLMGMAYYGGLVIGSFRIEKFIMRVGHIRAFSAFASTLATVCVLQGLIFNLEFWFVLRIISGFATAGLFIVIESWLLILGTIKTRGSILALYMIALYAGQGAGQFFISLGNTVDLNLYAIAGMLGSLSVIPLAMSKIAAPKIEEVSELDLRMLLKKAPTGLSGSLSSGLILGAVYSLFPVYLQLKTQSHNLVALYMAIIIFGGMTLQYPVGKVSDYIDRRFVMIVICLSTILMCALLMSFLNVPYLGGAITFILGGMIFTLYPLSVTYGCEALDNKELVAGTQGLLLAYSIGAMLGPVIAPGFMKLIGNEGLPIFISSISSVLAIIVVIRKLRFESRPHEESFLAVTQTTPIISEIDPRSD